MIKAKRLFALLLAGFCMLSLLVGCIPPSRSNLAVGILNFKQQNYRDAFLRLKPVAQAGNPEAQYAVGYMYYYGLGVVEDHHEAKLWLERAAAQHQPQAIQALQLLCAKPEAGASSPTVLQKYEPL